MGLMRFISPADRITEEAARRAYLAGYDKTPWNNQFRLADGVLDIERAVSDSGKLHIPWEVEGRGFLSLATGTLPERAEPYHLPLELARGTLGQLRNQRAQWAAMGWDIPREVDDRLVESVALFGRATVDRHGSDRSNQLAQQVLCMGIEVGEWLAASYVEQMLAARKQDSLTLDSLLGGDLGSTVPDAQMALSLSETFNTAFVPLCWREIETAQDQYDWDTVDRQIRWSRASGLAVCAGPMIRFDSRFLPDRIAGYEGNFGGLFSQVSRFVQSAVDRYRDQVDVWLCGGRVNGSSMLSLTEEWKVRLIARAIELVRHRDPESPILISFDRPWAEYLNRDTGVPPLYFADALIRANLGISGLMLDINVGPAPDGTFPRDLLAFGRLMDYWSLLGMPLFVTLSVPGVRRSEDSTLPRELEPPSAWWTPERQADWVDRYVPLLLAKPNVQGIFWNQLLDAKPNDASLDVAHGGLFDPEQRPKPALARLAAIRRANLK